MDTIIGLGAAGCRIADEFAKYPQYTTYKIDIGISGKNAFPFPKCNTPEEYEKNTPDLSAFFKNITDDILFIVGGGGKISGASLQILKQLKNKNINILYIKPNVKSLTKTGALQDKLTFNVLQEYARSGLFKKIILIYNPILETLVGEVPLTEFNAKLNELIVSGVHYINVFTHTQPVFENVEPPKEIHRITTIGICDLKNNIITPFFNLQNVGYKCYYHAVPESVLKSDGKLFKMIKEKAAEDQSSFQIHTTKHENSFAYFTAYTNFIQSVDNAS